MIGASGFSLPHMEDARKTKINGAGLEAMIQNLCCIAVASGKQYEVFETTDAEKDNFLQKILGPSGTLRAPALIFRKRLIVGFNEEMYERFIFSPEAS
ncbi:hypothetical protein OOT00_08465 [Desulfobotulus sp. H1]|uniref:Glutaredoxin domain-containing protein n=1 Tax=Desulfobotulus pelophilus TaxID=2823377 RepID=A0ABT3N976_9BACT|nr:hypothetical protein [Desulfobotulus pelophilus]MCW7754018.1 hypothetical protein [Desulfobotulus pelophilus]